MMIIMKLIMITMKNIIMSMMVITITITTTKKNIDRSRTPGCNDHDDDDANK